MNCKEKENKLDICFTGNEGYKYPFPVVLDTFLFINEIVEINENKNRISPTIYVDAVVRSRIIFIK